MADDNEGRWHELQRHFEIIGVTMAVIEERQREAHAQGDRIEQALSAIHQRIDGLVDRTTLLENQFGKLEEKFAPVRNVVYGLVGLILLTVVGALLVVVIQGR